MNDQALTADNIRVLVTGGQGFLGSIAVRTLVEMGVHVTVFDQGGTFAFTHEATSPLVVSGDIRDRSAVRNAMRGMTHVLHAAAVVSGWTRDPSVMYDVNVAGTRTVLEAAREAECARVVHVSSTSAICLKGNGLIDEQSIVPRTEGLSDYARSKTLAESEVLKALDGGVDAVTVYPTRVFGVGTYNDSNAAGRVLQMYLHGRLPVLPGGGSSYANWAFAADVGRGMAQALFGGESGKRYFLGGENATLRDVLTLADSIAGSRHHPLAIPHGIGRFVASAENLRSRLFGSRPLITPEWYDAVFESVQMSCAAATKDFGYRITPLADAMTGVVRWILNGNTSEA